MIAELQADGTASFELSRTFPFPRALVFETWLSEKHLRGWMGPTSDINLCHIEVNPHVGGSYRFGFKDEAKPEAVQYVQGEYLHIEEPEKLAFTWEWEAPEPDAGQKTLVTVLFKETEAGTEITLKHQKFTTNEACVRHQLGWDGTLHKMDQHLKAL